MRVVKLLLVAALGFSLISPNTALADRLYRPGYHGRPARVSNWHAGYHHYSRPYYARPWYPRPYWPVWYGAPYAYVPPVLPFFNLGFGFGWHHR
jgi:hypothetical protein